MRAPALGRGLASGDAGAPARRAPRAPAVAVGALLWGLGIGLASAQPAVHAPGAPAGTHTVQPGETLWDISRQHLGRPLLWPEVQQRNRVGEPRLLQIGRVLQLGDAERQAVVMAATGDVRLADGPSAGTLLVPGMRLPEGSRVRTGADSFVTLRLPDGSRATLPSQSVLRLVHYFDAQGRPAVLVDLESGDVESRVPPRPRPAPGGAWRVRTRMATVGVRGTHFRVSLPQPDRTAVSVLESAVAVNTAAQRGQQVAAAQGLLVGDGSQAAQVQPLLPAPEWVEPGRAQNQPEVLLAWHGVPGAGSYRAQVAGDAEFVQIVAEQRLPAQGDAGQALFGGLAPGTYFARVAALTPEGVEGLVAVTGFSRAQAVLEGRAQLLAASGEIEFDWRPLPGATYRLEVADDEAFRQMRVQAAGLTSERVRVQALPPGQYWWRVQAEVVDQGQRAQLLSPPRPLSVEGVR
ncbi:FecR domain-containing protein [Xenophilus sp. Marseille-Q4582]|uniref:FecR domain-containing protein n=1 Tax=Xenophilus sp. Marseille-Q4582 TaxID=2866600 RepID=UPI001CE40DBA|nr:FecR domain-containing protein [Xenophilus sp. Marseille-Q4582]